MFDWRNKFNSPSRMDTFAMYLTNEYWGRKDEDGELIEFTDQLFVDELLKKFKKTPEMKAGTALHKIIEEGKYNQDLERTIVIEDETFNFYYYIENHVNITVPILREQKIQKTFGDIIINGRVDAIDATTVYDHKFTKQIRYEKYANSYQGNIYLWMTGLNYFTYNVFQGKITKIRNIQDIGISIATSYDIGIDKFEEFTFERYAGMDKDTEDFYTYYWEILDKLKPLIIETAYKNNIIIEGLTYEDTSN